MVYPRTDYYTTYPGPSIKQVDAYRAGQENQTYLSVDNLATRIGREACDMSKVSQFHIEKVETCMSMCNDVEILNYYF